MTMVPRLALIGGLMASLVPVITGQAALADSICQVTVTPHELAAGTAALVQLDLQNTGPNALHYLRLQRPNANYEINGISQSDWIDVTDGQGTTLTGGTLDLGGNYSFQLAVQTAPVGDSDQHWSVVAGEQADGSDATACAGDTQVSITPPDTTPTGTGLSGIGLARIQPTTATIIWHSQAATTSYVFYGTGTDYESTATASGSVLDHRVAITGLTPSTTYHYRVSGTDQTGVNVSSTDNVFVTPELPPPVVVATPLPPGNTASATPTVISRRPTIVVAPTAGDVTAPLVSLVLSTATTVTAPPLLKAQASDNAAIARIEFSVNGGHDWLVADQASGLGTARASASLTPRLVQDGNYVVLARAIDGNGNEGRSTATTVVLDRLPPRSGGLVLNLGPQLITPEASGVVSLSSGAAYGVTSRSVGGAVSMELIATRADASTQTVSLSEDPGTGLWQGTFMPQARDADVSVRLIDGAGNITLRPLFHAAVSPLGSVINLAGQPIKQGTAQLYYHEPLSGNWELWDAAPYGQRNPQALKNGEYGFFAPPGDYYLRVTAPGYRTTLTRRFTLSQAQAVSALITLAVQPSFSVAGHQYRLPTLTQVSAATVRQAFKYVAAPARAASVVPSFSLTATNGSRVTTVDLRGRPTIITLMDGWSPQTEAQLAALAALPPNEDVNIVPVVLGASPEATQAQLKLAGLSLTVLCDPTNSLAEPFGFGLGPKHLVIDRNGHIKKVTVNVLSKAQITSALSEQF